jgi:hypothetical protein
MDDDLWLEIETDSGLFVRHVQPASPLPTHAEVGAAAEVSTRSSASTFGLPDFVFRPTQSVRGSGVRELGDAMVVVGDVAAVVQVKARAASSNRDARERAWLDKKISTAVRQARGTIRTLLDGPAALVNERDREILIDGTTKEWISVIVIDHPHPPDDYVPLLAGPPTAVLIRRDWEFLFEQVKSTDAVLRYLLRVSSMPARPLGHEAIRYYELAAADAAAPPEPPDLRLVRPGVIFATTPVLPQAPAAHEGKRSHLLLRMLLEDVATTPRPDGLDEAHMLDVLAAVDTLAVGYRGELGETLLSWLDETKDQVDSDVRWRIRSVKFPNRPHLVFAVASRWNEAIGNGFSMLVTLRHQQMFESLVDDEALLTAGLLLTPRHHGRRPWDTTMAAIQGKLDLSPDYRHDLEELWPIMPAE